MKPVVALLVSYNVHYFELVALYCLIICKKTFFNKLNKIDYKIIDQLEKICNKLFNITGSVYPQSVRPYICRGFKILPKFLRKFVKKYNGKGIIQISEHDIEHTVKLVGKRISGHSNAKRKIWNTNAMVEHSCLTQANVQYNMYNWNLENRNKTYYNNKLKDENITDIKIEDFYFDLSDFESGNYELFYKYLVALRAMKEDDKAFKRKLSEVPPTDLWYPFYKDDGDYSS